MRNVCFEKSLKKHTDFVCHDVSVGGDEFVFRGAIKLAGLHRKRRFVLRGSWLGALHFGGLYREQL